VAVLVIVRGPDAYVSPSWYATKAEHGRVVPTWEHVVAHVHGELVVHSDPDWLAAHVARLTEADEGTRAGPWAVTDAPERSVAGQLRAIVGVEVRISRVEAKWKLSQNRSAADLDGVVAGLAADGQHQVAAAVRVARPD
jgi:transcriptional regulator